MSILKSIRKYYWLTQAFTTRHYKTVLRATVIGIILVSLSMFLLQYAPTYRPHQKIGKIGKYTTTTLPNDILSQVSLGLVTIDANGNFAPGLAKSWRIEDDGKTYIFKVDTTKKWHDGTNVSPNDINYNFKEVTQTIEGDSITYSLQEPFSPFLSALSKPILKDHKFGVGEYQLTTPKESSGGIQNLTLTSLNKIITYQFYPTESSILTAYKLGEINQVDGLNYIDEEIKSEPRNQIIPSTEDGKIAVLFFNNNDTLLGSKSTRQALAYAIKDKSFGNKRVLTPISSNSQYYNDTVKTYDFDAEKDHTLLKIDVQDPKSVKIELKTMLQYLTIAEAIAQDWRDNLGIAVDVKVVGGITNDYQVLLADYAPPIDPDQYSIWHSTQSTNFTHFANLKIDKLLEDGRRTLDTKLRKEIYQDFQRFLIEDCPAVFLFETKTFSLSRKGLFKY